MTMFELQAGAPRGLGDKQHLDLAGVVRVSFDPPFRADVPAEHDPIRWLVGEDARPPAFGAIDCAVVDVPADPRLEHGLGNLYPEQVVLRRLEVAEPLGNTAKACAIGASTTTWLRTTAAWA